MQSIKLTITIFALLVIAMTLVSAKPNAKPATATNSNGDEERLPIGPDGSLFLTGNDCGPNEQLAPGSLPTCEPTCDNPRPGCPKVFFSGLDYVPCFCKKPLVRNVKTKQCIPLSECPK